MAKLSGLLERLSEMEEAAARIYWKAGAAVSGDRELEDLLKELAAEEEEHMRVLTGLGRHIRSTESLASIDVDEGAVSNIEGYFLLAEKRIDAGRLTNDTIVDCIATTESSEWNREFIKVISALKENSRLFIPMAARVQQHKRCFERFLGSRPRFSRFLAGMRSLPNIWEEKLLVVDDDRAIADVVTAVLEEEGSIETAGDGVEALKKIESGYYAAIVSDLSMPRMNGMELLSRAEERFPGIRSRFLFFTSDHEGMEFFKGKGVRALMKPSSAAELAGEVASILGRPY